ncbi:MAG: hypothetical protein HFI09_00520 [Bacilli bacterium]|nr:hypothetical protein [Bacilli bacterium]
MNANLQIMNDNMLYFNEWVKRNESWQGKLEIIGNDLVYHGSVNPEKVDISHYYLPQILENQMLREQIQINNKLQAEDIFRIIRVNILAEEENEPTSLQDDHLITNVLMRQDDQGQYFLVVEDNLGNKFKITQNMELVLQLYQKLRSQNPIVYYQKFKEEVEAIRHE